MRTETVAEPVTTHTPGPWKTNLAEGGNLFVLSSDGSPIAAFQTTYAEFERGEQRIANARLIAASPRLLDALKGVVGLVQLIKYSGDHDGTVNHRFVEALAAIEEAEGLVAEPQEATS